MINQYLLRFSNTLASWLTRRFYYIVVPILLASNLISNQAMAEFTDVTVESGITHVSTSIPEMDTGGGVAWIDIDNDGFQDLYVPNPVVGASWLYHNIADGAGGRTFVEIANLPGSDAHNSAYASTGVAVGDYDNDGCDDLFITNGGNGVVGSSLYPVVGGPQRNTLLRNNFCDNSSLTFIDTTITANLHKEQRNSMVASFGDLDRDGDLDLYIGNYIPNGDMGSAFPTCDLNTLHLNNGKGSFTEVSGLLGVDDRGCTLGVVMSDYNNDGMLDIYVSNDFSNHLDKLDTIDRFYQNTGNDANGTPSFLRDTQSNLADAVNGMGIAVGDYDQDGDLDYYTTSFSNRALTKQNTLNRNNGPDNNGNTTFQEVAALSGVADPGINPGFPDVCQPNDSSCSVSTVGWGSVFFDVENDGDLDLYKVNGLVQGAFTIGTTLFPNRLFINNGLGVFTDQGASLKVDGTLDTSLLGLLCGGDLNLPCFDQGRGVAAADYDNDGDIDLFTVSTASIDIGPTRYTPLQPHLYRNKTISRTQSNGNSWLQIRLKGIQSNQRGIGAKVLASSTSSYGIKTTQMQEVHAGSSHGSTHGFPVHFGFSAGSTINSLLIKWPMGKIKAVGGSELGLNQLNVITEDQGTAVKSPTIDQILVDFSPSSQALWSSKIMLFGNGFCALECNSNTSTETTITVGTISVSPVFVQENVMTFYMPAGITGTVSMSVTTLGMTSNTQPMTVQAPPIPTISEIGSVNGGRPLIYSKAGDFFIIMGENFCVSFCKTAPGTSTETTVSIGNFTFVPNYVDKNLITFTMPDIEQVITGPVIVTTMTQASVPSSKIITVTPAPEITSVMNLIYGETKFTLGSTIAIDGTNLCSQFCDYYSTYFPDGKHPEIDIQINGITYEPTFVNGTITEDVILLIITESMTTGFIKIITPWGIAISAEPITIQ